VGGEPIPEILGGEVVQRCPGHGTGERGDIVSLIIDGLHELRQRRPVSLANESLVELAGQGSPPLLRSDLSRSNQPCFDLVDGLQGFLRGSSGVAVPLLHVGEQGLPHRVKRHLEAGADGVAALIPVRRGAGGEDARRLCWACSGGRLVSRSSTSRSPSDPAWSSTVVSAAGPLGASRSAGSVSSGSRACRGSSR
jgi:hypothetical protein